MNEIKTKKFEEFLKLRLKDFADFAEENCESGDIRERVFLITHLTANFVSGVVQIISNPNSEGSYASNMLDLLGDITEIGSRVNHNKHDCNNDETCKETH